MRDYKQYLESKYHDDFETWADSIEAGVARQKEMFKDMERSPLEVGVDRSDLRVVDKGRGFGGRMASRRIDTPNGVARFDHGAQFFTTRSDRRGLGLSAVAYIAAPMAALWLILSRFLGKRQDAMARSQAEGTEA